MMARLKGLYRLAAVGGAGFASYLATIRPIVIHWGTTDAELKRRWPGDELSPDAWLISTHSITIHGTPDDIWPWLVQIGNGRAGWYSFRFVERLVKDGQLLDEGASHRILPQFQNLQLGDCIPVADTKFKVIGLEPGRLMAMDTLPDASSRHATPPAGSGSTTQAGFNFILEPIDAQTTRLTARMRIAAQSLWQLVYVLGFLEPGHAIMQTKMLHGIKARVECQRHSR